MPLSSTDSRRMAMDEYVRLRTEQYGVRMEPMTFYEGYDNVVPIRQSISERAAKAARTRGLKKWEKEQAEFFIKTGTSQELKLLLDVNLTLRVMGHSLKEGKVMFLLDSEKITLHNKRSKHLIPLLTKLAEAEGLNLEFVDEYPDLPEAVRVAFWRFNNGEEVDDTNIVLQAQARQPQSAIEMEDAAFYDMAMADFDRGQVVLTDDTPF